MSASEEGAIKMFKRIIVNVEISTLTSEEKADEISAQVQVLFPNKIFTFLDVTMALYELEMAKKHLLEAGHRMESSVKECLK